MSSDWNEELDKYENGRRFGEDLKDSVRATFSVLRHMKGSRKEHHSVSKENGYTLGSQGWGNYVNGEKMYYSEDD